MTGGAKPSGSATGIGAELEAIESGIIDHLFDLQPGYAVFLGLHQYDGRMPDLSTAATARWAVGAKGWLAKLRALDLGPLDAGRRLDSTLLELLLESPLFDLEESRDLERNPMSYVGPISLTAFMIREYAPVAPRVDAMVRVIEGVPALLENGRRRLESRVPTPFVQLAMAMGSGLPSHFEEA
ncbi:MAG: DUF885 domain-containing protein, partial [Thermoplasmata archaeon]|nr:DUF885 domain-containing protein [Thermoplasmata archaeon]